MGKYNLGKSTTEMHGVISNEKLSINDTKAKKVVKDIDNQLDIISNSLYKINNILNRSVSMGVIKGTRGNSFKSWAKKSKAQADNSLKIKNNLDQKYEDDVRNYPIKLLDERIKEIEKKLESMNN